MSGSVDLVQRKKYIPQVISLQLLRELEAELGLDLIVIAVHVTSVSKGEAQNLLENSEIVISCASK